MRLIIDCDPGNGVPGANVDDGLALALALAAKPQLQLELISIVAGNTRVKWVSPSPPSCWRRAAIRCRSPSARRAP